MPLSAGCLGRTCRQGPRRPLLTSRVSRCTGTSRPCRTNTDRLSALQPHMSSPRVPGSAAFAAARSQRRNAPSLGGDDARAVGRKNRPPSSCKSAGSTDAGAPPDGETAMMPCDPSGCSTSMTSRPSGCHPAQPTLRIEPIFSVREAPVPTGTSDNACGPPWRTSAVNPSGEIARPTPLEMRIGCAASDGHASTAPSGPPPSPNWFASATPVSESPPASCRPATSDRVSRRHSGELETVGAQVERREQVAASRDVGQRQGRWREVHAPGAARQGEAEHAGLPARGLGTRRTRFRPALRHARPHQSLSIRLLSMTRPAPRRKTCSRQPPPSIADIRPHVCHRGNPRSDESAGKNSLRFGARASTWPTGNSSSHSLAAWRTIAISPSPAMSAKGTSS